MHSFTLEQYQQYLDEKDFRYHGKSNIDMPTVEINPALYPHQKDIVTGCIRRGRSAVFADTGLGKTLIELEFAAQVVKHTGCKALLIAPLAVARQIAELEAPKFGYDVSFNKTGDLSNQITITNYESIEKFDFSQVGCVVLDESSILKSFQGKTRTLLTELCHDVAFRLACTATPSPNDLFEITNHAEWLGIKTGNEIRALYFINEGNSVFDYRLKKHSVDDFWRWVGSWSYALTKPSDMGYDDTGYILKGIEYHKHIINTGIVSDGEMFPRDDIGLSGLRSAKSGNLTERVQKAAEVVATLEGPVIVWCERNDESALLKKAIPDAIEVKGADTETHKIDSAMAFARGEIDVLISKPKIFGFGMNWQSCANIVFVGLTYSFEMMYQAIRRCHRFGQMKDVHVHIVMMDVEAGVLGNITKKEQGHRKMISEIVERYKEHAGTLESVDYSLTEMSQSNKFKAYGGDCVPVMRAEMKDDSVDLIVYSPPFPSMYAYTDEMSDMGNNPSLDSLMEHYRYVLMETFRVLKPGRTACVHLQQSVLRKAVVGYVGRADFRGKVIATAIELGWIYASEVTIDKCPQVRAIRTKDRGLLFKSLATDASVMQPAAADYVLFLRKPGKSEQPIKAGQSDKYKNPEGWITQEEWIEWAAPVWYRRTAGYAGGIYETDVLNVSHARDVNDEMHLCPLQLGVIERCIKLFSAPGETVFSPFMGVASEGVGALRAHRKYVGIELKPSYYQQSVKNLKKASMYHNQMELV